MTRLYQEHAIRQRWSLDGVWDFGFSDDPDAPAAYTHRLVVPGCWDADPAFALRRGVGFYRRRFSVHESGRYRLVFQAVANDARVWIDGRELVYHYGSHTQFTTPEVDLSAGEHIVQVKADNRFGPHNTLLQQICGWYCYGGIHRSVCLERVSDVRIDSLHVTTESLDGTSAELRIDVALTNTTDTPAERLLRLAVPSIWETQIQLDLPPGTTRHSETVRLDNVTPWSSEEPKLYFLQADCGDDDLIDRFGIRTIRCQGRDILLNGRPIRLRGINHCDYHPESGYTCDLLRMKRDLDLIQGLGLNFVRTSHYPKDQQFLDLCDEMGLLVLEEAPGWQNGRGEMQTPLFYTQLSGSLREMVDSHYNHPSIIIWGMLNEMRSENKEHRPVVERLFGDIRQLDQTRPVTFATNRLLLMEDQMLDLVDILSPNLYNRWYNGEYGPYSDHPGAFLEKLIELFDQKGLGNKPIVIGEFGAGAVPGNHRLDRRRWSEEYQVDVLREALEVYDAHPRVSGYAIWLFADTASSENEERSRPTCHNCKGLLDPYRNPKMAYYAVGEVLSHSKSSVAEPNIREEPGAQKRSAGSDT